jgi:hypothetical protein
MLVQQKLEQAVVHEKHPLLALVAELLTPAVLPPLMLAHPKLEHLAALALLQLLALAEAL